MTDWQVISGGVTAPKGFKAAGIAAGLKPSGTADLALIVSQTEAIAAGVFTTSQVHAACIDYCRQRLQAKASSRAIMCNAGQANAATGKQGWQDVLESASLLAEVLNISPNEVLLASTGVIGQNICMERMRQGIPNLVSALSDTGGDAAAEAIITTDLLPKSIALETSIDGRPVRIGGMAKGSGMIHPKMATMLSFITCDGLVSTPLWQKMITQAADKSFNQITVDGDTSTNDCFIALANGQSRTPTITEMSKDAEKLQAMLNATCRYLAKAIARDGEGATCLIEVQVSGATDDKKARRVAKTVAKSSLVKSAIFGRDPNWGRIAAAAGNADVTFRQEDLRVKLGDLLMLEGGQPLEFDRQKANSYLKRAAAGAYLQGDTVLISICIGNGTGQGTAWGCDLSYDYVKINSEYTT